MAAKSPARVEGKPKATSLARYALLAAIGILVAAGAILLSAGHGRSKRPGGSPAASFSNGAPPSAEGGAAGASAAQGEIRRFIESYFRGWSAGDMDAYKSHFDPSARIALIEDGRVLVALDRDPFVAEQARIVAASPVRMTEHMTSFAAEADETAAQVAAGWELRKGSETSTGVDRFTLIRDPEGRWKIIYLAFYLREGR